jgi:hypothetical protein
LVRVIQRQAYEFRAEQYIPLFESSYVHVARTLRVEEIEASGGASMAKTQYMVIEHFKNQDAVPVYRRFRDRGRLAPEGLTYVSSWVDDRFERCYQIMETEDRSLLEHWIANWSDIIDFEVYPVMSSGEAVQRITPRL